MPSRRTLLAGSAAALALPARAAPSPPVRFGVIADPQYADAPPNLAMDRHYANSLDKLAAAIHALNAEDLDFVVTLGDLIDRDWASFEPVLALYGRLRHAHVPVLGNHDFSVAPDRLGDVPGRVGLARTYGDFAVHGVRFLRLDGNAVSLFAPPRGDPRWSLAQDRLGELRQAGAVNAQPWNGALGAEQTAWLDASLAGAAARGERVVVLNHYPAYPANPHNLWDADAVTALLARHPQVVAYLNGHNHAGNYGERDGIHYVNFRGMVDTPHETAFAVATLGRERLEIRGYGREPSRSLALRGT